MLTQDNLNRGIYSMLVMGLLSIGDMYAYQISQELHRLSEDVLIVKGSNIYPVLYRLAKDGYISDHREIAGNRIRVYYHLEESGYKQLKSIVSEYKIIFRGVTNILNKVMQSERR